MPSLTLKTDELYNPLDIAERVIMDRDWVFDRPDEGELIAEATGHWGRYRLWLNWQAETGGLTLSCALDTKFAKQQLPKIYALLAVVNEKLWLGHFDICTQESAITFRHTLLSRDSGGISAEHLQELIDIAVEECERFYPAFQSVIWGGKSPQEALEISLFETIAEA